MATFADDTAIMSSEQDHTTASQKLQQHLNLQTWMEQWKITIKPTKSTQIAFTTRRADCPQVRFTNFPIPIKQEVKYLGLHLDKKPTWSKHIKLSNCLN
jgi:hypothetical protein